MGRDYIIRYCGHPFNDKTLNVIEYMTYGNTLKELRDNCNFIFKDIEYTHVLILSQLDYKYLRIEDKNGLRYKDLENQLLDKRNKEIEEFMKKQYMEAD